MVVDSSVELLVEVTTVFDVDVTVELMVAVSVAVCAGDVSRVGLARDGDVTRRTTKTSSTPSVIAWARSRVGNRLVPFRNPHFFLVLLMTPTATRPTMIPARIDSHGKPGIPGNCIVLLLNTVEVSVLTLVLVEVVGEVLVLVVDSVMRLVEVDVVVVEALVEVNVYVPELSVIVDDPEVTTTVVVPAPEPLIGGLNGSRWKTPASGVVTILGPAPTAHPSCVLPGWPYTE